MKDLLLNTNTHFLSVDLEDWHTSAYLRNFVNNNNFVDRIEHTTHLVLDLFDKKNVSATFFVLGSVAEKFPLLIKEIHAQGHEIASHGFSHIPLWQINKEQFKNEILLTNNILENITGEKVIGFRAPYASIDLSTQWAIDVLIEHGFQYDSSVFPMKIPLYGVSDAPLHPYYIDASNMLKHSEAKNLIEIPFTVFNFSKAKIPVTGGIYGRFLPKNLLKFLLLQSSKKRAINFYFHPWEIDKEIPVINAPLYNQLVSYYGVQSYANKIEGILDAFTFTSFSKKLRAEKLI